MAKKNRIVKENCALSLNDLFPRFVATQTVIPKQDYDHDLIGVLFFISVGANLGLRYALV